jgi:hypothetical protein
VPKLISLQLDNHALHPKSSSTTSSSLLEKFQNPDFSLKMISELWFDFSEKKFTCGVFKR